MTVNALHSMIALLRADTVVKAEVGSVTVYRQTLVAITGRDRQRMGKAHAPANRAGKRGGRASQNGKGAFELASLRRAKLREGARRSWGRIGVERDNP